MRRFTHRLPDVVEKIRNDADAAFFKSHLSSWNTLYKPVFFQIPTKRGFGFSFNILGSQKMFKET